MHLKACKGHFVAGFVFFFFPSFIRKIFPLRLAGMFLHFLIDQKNLLDFPFCAVILGVTL